MEKVIQFKLSTGWYRGADTILCGSEIRDYLNLAKRAFDMHISTRRPSGDDFYPIVRKGTTWYLEDVSRGRASPWPATADAVLSEMFPRAKRLYVWAMQ